MKKNRRDIMNLGRTLTLSLVSLFGLIILVGYNNCGNLLKDRLVGINAQSPKLYGTGTGNALWSTEFSDKGFGMGTNEFSQGLCEYVSRCVPQWTEEKCIADLDSVVGLSQKIMFSPTDLSFKGIRLLEAKDAYISDLEVATNFSLGFKSRSCEVAQGTTLVSGDINGVLGLVEEEAFLYSETDYGRANSYRSQWLQHSDKNRVVRLTSYGKDDRKMNSLFKVPVVAGQRYTVSAKILSEEFGLEVALNAYVGSSSIPRMKDFSKSTTAAGLVEPGQWHTLEFEIEIPQSSEYLKLGLDFLIFQSGATQIDDVRVVEHGSSQNLVRNPNFDTNPFLNWVTQ